MYSTLLFLAKTLSVILLILTILGGHQYFIYQREGGVFVADKYTEPQLSKQIYFRGRTLAKAATSTQLGGPTGTDLVSFMRWKEKWAYWNALRKFPTLQSCLSDGGDGANTLLNLNWNALRTNTQTELCLYHVGTALKTPEAIADWLSTQGFETNIHRNVDPAFFDGENFVVIRGRWEASSGSPYSLISGQTLQQYDPLFMVFGLIGIPKIRFLIGPRNTIFNTEVTSLASK